MFSHRARAAMVAAAATLGATSILPATAGAAVTSTVDAAGLHVLGDAGPNAIVLTRSGNFIAVNGTATTQAAGAAVAIDVDAGDADDTIDATALGAADYAKLVATGNTGDDLLEGGAGADRLIGSPGTDVLDGNAGADTLVWNNGDGTDIDDGGADSDTLEVNGSTTGADEFTIKPGTIAGHVQFNRISLNGATTGNFGIDTSTTERVVVNGGGGDDKATGAAGLAPLLSGGLALNGGDGNDVLTGGDGNDALDGGAGDDLLTGDKGADSVSGGDGNDALVWNNGEGSDVDNGGAGFDTIIVNGSTAGDVFTVEPSGVRTLFKRTNLGQFSLDIDSEALLVNAAGGDDSLAATAGLGSRITVLADGGSGNDAFTGSGEDDSFFGGDGNDSLVAGGGLDLLDGQDGNDTINARDGDPDAVRGGNGDDTAVTDARTVDGVGGVEHLDATVIPPADTRALAPTLGAVTISRSGSRLTAKVPPQLSGCGDRWLLGHAEHRHPPRRDAGQVQGRRGARHRLGEPQGESVGHAVDPLGVRRREAPEGESHALDANHDAQPRRDGQRGVVLRAGLSACAESALRRATRGASGGRPRPSARRSSPRGPASRPRSDARDRRAGRARPCRARPARRRSG